LENIKVEFDQIVQKLQRTEEEFLNNQEEETWQKNCIEIESMNRLLELVEKKGFCQPKDLLEKLNAEVSCKSEEISM
jgi:hypothetical protein